MILEKYVNCSKTMLSATMVHKYEQISTGKHQQLEDSILNRKNSSFRCGMMEKERK